MNELITIESSGRIDKVISERKNIASRSHFTRLLEQGEVKLNNEIITNKKVSVKPGDIVEIHFPESTDSQLLAEDIPLDIIYEDDDVLVVNKPQGMVVHPSNGHDSGTLVNALKFHSPLSSINGEYRPGIVHRIDKDTSGLLMVAKNDAAHIFLQKELHERKNLREYIALVHGVIHEDKGKINAPIGRDKKNRLKQAVVADGKNSETSFEVMERFANFTLVKLHLTTGRTHQIRVHMNYIGHPIAGDLLYGPKKILEGNGQFLHAARLGFIHPRTKKEMVFSAPLPEVFENQLKKLRKKERE